MRFLGLEDCRHGFVRLDAVGGINGKEQEVFKGLRDPFHGSVRYLRQVWEKRNTKEH